VNTVTAPTVARSVGFGTTQAFRHFDPERLVEDVRRAEALGYDSFGISDHLHSEHPTYEPWTALTGVASETERIKVMPNVLGLAYRAPAVIAKMAETLDRLSGGRLVLGLGSGGYDEEFSAFGMCMGTDGQKVDALGEATGIIRALWTKPQVTVDGEHFQVHGARIEPTPIHAIPIWLGTYGPRAMRAAVRAGTETAGRNPDEITCAANIVVEFDPRPMPTPQAMPAVPTRSPSSSSRSSAPASHTSARCSPTPTPANSSRPMSCPW
jgi:alkanesulfonate monooxygenase SsuD/methylene tetrahydromethanopterin reductase-like flavin-dependent oxidoreductase (luciferase family)